MSNPLHDKATRAVSIALFPVFVALGGTLVWHLQPLPQTTPLTHVAPRVFDDSVNLPDPRPIDSVVEIPTQVITLESKAAPAPAPVKEKVCEEYAMYNSKTEKVLICNWE
jgi:hypothetical protein